ncbi:Glycosyl transferase group 1 [Geitlerinema sp. FC II]|nr:Glycosyl transferase group 1 [Geitlerinema sp. FC II]
MKISLLAPDLSGGGGTRAYLLAQVLKHLDFEVTVFGFLFGDRLYPEPPAGLSVRWVAGCDYPQFVRSVRQLLQQIDGDLLYAIKPRPTSFGVALLHRRFHHKPVLLDIDDWETSWFGGDEWTYRPTPRQFLRDVLKPNGALRNPEYPLYLKWVERAIDRADAVTVDTTFLQERYGGTYLPNGKDTRLFDPEHFEAEESRRKYGLSEYRVLMFPGTARPHKGLEDVLTALDRLDREEFRLVLVGGREIGDGYVEYLMDKWSRWVIKLPSMPVDRMPEVVAAADLVVVPQRDDVTARAQFPIKLTDGMAMAKPILATRVGDVPKVLEDTGFIVEPNAPHELAEKIVWIFDNYELAKKRGRTARDRCIKYYSLDAMSDILSKTVRNAIA